MQEYINFIQEHVLISIIWCFFLIGSIATMSKMLFSKIKMVSYQDVILSMNEEDAVVIDVRSREDFKKGHIIHSIQIDMSDIKASKIIKLDKFKQRKMILVCGAGSLSEHAAQLLFKQGFADIGFLKGGLEEWKANHLPLTHK